MARIRLLEGHDAPMFARFLNWASRRMYGKDLLPVKVMAHAPRFLLPYLGMNQFAQGKTQLPATVRQLAMHLVAERNGCAWCADYGQFLGMRHGLTPEKLAAVSAFAENPLFSPAERAALAFADEMTNVGGRVSDETFAAVREHFSERETVELATAVAAENFFNRMNVAFGIEAQGFCALPTREAAAHARAA